jgi:hypothetical protein
MVFDEIIIYFELSVDIKTWSTVSTNYIMFGAIQLLPQRISFHFIRDVRTAL